MLSTAKSGIYCQNILSNEYGKFKADGMYLYL